MIKIENLTHKIEDNIIIDNLSLEINQKFTTIIGPSGCGKSQLLKKIIELNNNLKLGYLPQKLNLLEWYDVEQNLQIFNVNNKDIDLILENLKLSELKNRYINSLSGGQQARVAFARAYIMSEDYILLDEPFSKLDYITHQKTMKWLKEVIEKEDINIILVTHNLDEAIYLSDEIVVLKDKAVVVNKYINEFDKNRLIKDLDI